MHGTVRFEGADAVLLERVRSLCLAYPEAVEVEQFGLPWFKAGKRPFLVFGHQRDDPQIAFALSRDDQEALVAMAPDRFFPTPYLHQHGWTSLRIADDPDWPTIERLTDDAYRKVALQRMLKTLD